MKRVRRRRAARWALALALIAGPAAAQEPEVSDVPAGPARIHGFVEHPDGPARAAGADVVLYAIASGGQPGVRRVQAGPDGSFAFEGIAAADMVYLLGARYAGVPFVGERVAFDPGETERQVTIRVSERTSDPRGLSIEESSLRLERIGDELVGTEVIRIHNPGERVVFTTPDERGAGTAPAYVGELPEGVVRFALPYAIQPEGVVRKDRQVSYYGPVYPGGQELAFTWALPVGDGEQRVAKRYPSGAGRLTVLHPSAGIEVRAERMAPAEDAEIAGVAYRVLAAEAVPRDARFDLRIAVPEARVDANALAVLQTRTFLELDDAALSVNEELHLKVAGTTPVAAPPDRPLLRVPIPPDATGLRYGASGFASGITYEDGALVVRGPVPPGESRLDLRYQLPAAPQGARYAARFETDVPIAEVFIADTGLDVSSTRLHRRRPVRTPEERIFLHFEAFHVDAGETLELELAPLATRRTPTRALRAGAVVLVALGLVAFLAAPLRRAEAPEAAESDLRSAARRERDALYENIRDLDHDFETGKVSEADYAQMRDELRQRAVALVRDERSAAEAPAPQPAAAAGACAACGAQAGPAARFCSQCGAQLGADDPKGAHG
jgi:hypothetical protein